MDKGGSKADYENTSNAYKKYIEYLKKDPKK